MRPNLSLEKIAGALAVVGTSVLMGCGGGDKPAASPDVKANEVAPTSDKSATGQGHCGAEHKEHKPGEASCGAKGGSASCGAGKGGSASCGAGKGGSASCGASKSAADTKPADSTTTTTTTTTTTPSGTTPATPATPAKPGDKPADKAAPAKPGAAPAGKKAGAASCGAGTCSAKK
jgi:hypothetical protein